MSLNIFLVSGFLRCHLQVGIENLTKRIFILPNFSIFQSLYNIMSGGLNSVQGDNLDVLLHGQKVN